MESIAQLHLERQLTQLSRNAPDLFSEVQAILTVRPDLARPTITGAMIKLGHRLANPSWNKVWQKIEDFVEGQKPNQIPVNGEGVVCLKGDEQIILWRKANDELRVISRRNGKITWTPSKPVGYLGRDFSPNHQSSAYRGAWVVSKEARQNFEEWVNPVPIKSSGFRKQNGAWVQLY